MVVSDNLKAGVTKACFYEPGVNRTYAEMAGALRHRDPAGTAEAAERQGECFILHLVQFLAR